MQIMAENYDLRRLQSIQACDKKNKKNTNEKKILVELTQIYEAASIFKWNEHF